MNMLAGFLGGAAGAMGLGGGSFLLLYLTLIISEPQLKAQGINLLFFIPCAVISIFFHNKNKLVSWKAVVPLALGGIVGVGCGLWLVSIVSPNIIGKIFGGFLLIFGLVEVFKKERPKDRSPNKPNL
ncbi:MAG: sulfite exporter TauE/SafE family protein [Oscillospiraceae bacterium]|jgi:uncharacterized membrane protein YfcA|nr:sulfite exporter TauE/SafE family protein [Oscillospiraceae bacterium]